MTAEEIPLSESMAGRLRQWLRDASGAGDTRDTRDARDAAYRADAAGGYAADRRAYVPAVRERHEARVGRRAGLPGEADAQGRKAEAEARPAEASRQAAARVHAARGRHEADLVSRWEPRHPRMQDREDDRGEPDRLIR